MNFDDARRALEWHATGRCDPSGECNHSAWGVASTVEDALEPPDPDDGTALQKFYRKYPSPDVLVLLEMPGETKDATPETQARAVASLGEFYGGSSNNKRPR